jgi:GntR family transcriptional regulator
MQLHVVPGDELPIYRQIMHQVTDAVASGRLHPGSQLPSQRDLAEQLVISPLTVKKAYDELEREGLIETQRGRGTFVAAAAEAVDPGPQLARMRDAARQLVSRAHSAGVPLADLVRLLEDVDGELREEREARGESPP